MDTSHPDFSQDFLQEFDRLYEKYLQEHFEPALTNLNQALIALLDRKIPSSRRMRLRVEAGRIKSPNRTLLKAQTDKYRPNIAAPSDIFNVIRDIVGTRVTCNTLLDVYEVVGIIKACATQTDPARTLHKLHDDWEDDFIKNPKESGYRAVNLIVGVPVPVGSVMAPVTCEIQVRTLLQHAWGELTHEDTYKPGVKVPELVQVLSKRLATTLAVLDEIAQDLRNELGKVESIEVHEGLGAETVPSTVKEAAAEQLPVLETSGLEETAGQAATLPASAGAEAREPGQPLSKDDVVRAFEQALGRVPTISGDAVTTILKELEAAGVSRAEDLVVALTESSAPVQQLGEELSSQYQLHITDFGHLLGALRFREGAENGAAWTKKILEEAAEKRVAKEKFRDAYPVGREALGTVVYVGWEYALVQLPEGDTGILHVTSMKTRPEEYVVVSNVVRTGDAVRVRIRSVKPDKRRIELELVR